MPSGASERKSHLPAGEALRGRDLLHLSRSSRRNLEKLFAEFAPEEYDFRLSRLEQFREVTLDFAGVKTLGQGFADEVFRVFPAAHPDVILKRLNVPPAIEAVIKHVIDESRPHRLTNG